MKTSRNKTTRATKIKPLTAETETRKTANKLAFFSEDDPDGSYTGVPEDIFETPVQDVDDL